MDSIYLATPAYDGSVCMSYAQSLLRTYENCRINGIDLYTDYKSGVPYVCLARNLLAHRFLQSKCDALLFVDADLGWDYKAAVKLYRMNLPLVGGVYPRKQDSESYPIGLLDSYYGECREVMFLPTGFMMIRREVFKALEDKVPYGPDHGGKNMIRAYFQVYYGEQGMVGEDVLFCNRYRQTGGKVWLYPNIDFEHNGNKGWTGNYAQYDATNRLENAA